MVVLWLLVTVHQPNHTPVCEHETIPDKALVGRWMKEISLRTEISVADWDRWHLGWTTSLFLNTWTFPQLLCATPTVLCFFYVHFYNQRHWSTVLSPRRLHILPKRLTMYCFMHVGISIYSLQSVGWVQIRGILINAWWLGRIIYHNHP